MTYRFIEQQRHELVNTLAAKMRQGFQGAAMVQIMQQARTGLRFLKTQCRYSSGRFTGIQPQLPGGFAGL